MCTWCALGVHLVCTIECCSVRLSAPDGWGHSGHSGLAARSKKRRIAMLDGPCLGAGAAMALNHWNPDAAVAFHRQLGTNVGVFYPLSPLSRPSLAPPPTLLVPGAY